MQTLRLYLRPIKSKPLFVQDGQVTFMHIKILESLC